jgi:hypothetical protein
LEVNVLFERYIFWIILSPSMHVCDWYFFPINSVNEACAWSMRLKWQVDVLTLHTLQYSLLLICSVFFTFCATLAHFQLVKRAPVVHSSIDLHWPNLMKLFRWEFCAYNTCAFGAVKLITVCVIPMWISK